MRFEIRLLSTSEPNNKSSIWEFLDSFGTILLKFQNCFLHYSTVFLFNSQKVRVIITELKLLWKACEFPSFFVCNKIKVIT